jgi:2-haloacid dehalogenase
MVRRRLRTARRREDPAAGHHQQHDSRTRDANPFRSESTSTLTAAIDNAGLAGVFDQVLSVEEVGVYKPHRKVYQLACDRLGVAADAIVFLSSNAWDAHAAAAFGMRVAWCNRYGQKRERLPGSPDHEMRSLAELPPLVAGPIEAGG